MSLTACPLTNDVRTFLLGRQLEQGEGTGSNALAQLLSMDAGQCSLLTSADLARGHASGLLSQCLPLADARRTDQKCLRSNERSLQHPHAPEHVCEGVPNRDSSSMLTSSPAWNWNQN